MSNYEKIRERIDTMEQIYPAQEIELSESLGYILQEDILSESPMPPFNKSAVDGYACRKQDLDRDLQLLEVIPAGKVPGHKIGANQCARIMTGGVVPEEGKIRDTNSIQLISLLKQMHLRPVFYGIIQDNYEALSATFQQAIIENEIVIFTGGAAVSDFDLVPKIIEDEGFEALWTRTGLKPGNPMICAVKDQRYVFGLSGNPVSSFVQFNYLVMPVIYQLLGANVTPIRIKARMKSGYTRKNGSRLGVIPVRINREGEVEEIRFNGSAHINAIPSADAFIEIPAGTTTIEDGEMIYVRPI